MKKQTWTWTLGLVVVAITVLTGVASGVGPPSPAIEALVDFQEGWLCVGPAGSFQESFEVPGSSLALTTAGKPLAVSPTVEMPQSPDFHIAGRDFRRCW